MSPNRRSIATHHKTVSVFACAFKKQGSTCAFVPDIGAIARNFLGSCLFTMSTTSTTLLTRPPTVYHNPWSYTFACLAEPRGLAIARDSPMQDYNRTSLGQGSLSP